MCIAERTRMRKVELTKNKIGRQKGKLEVVGVKKRPCKRMEMAKKQEVIIVEEEAKTLSEWWKRTTAAVMECIAREEWKDMPGWKEEQEQEAERAIMKEGAKKSKNMKKKIAVDT